MNLDSENISCTKDEMRKAAEGHLTTEALMWNQNANQTTVSGMSSEDFRFVVSFKHLIRARACVSTKRKGKGWKRPHLKNALKVYLL